MALTTTLARLGVGVARLSPRAAIVGLRSAAPRIDGMIAMRSATVDSFVARRFAELVVQGHGPGRHEGAVTYQMMVDRVLRGLDPLTGTRVDGVTGRTHLPVRTTTRITNEADYVAAEAFLRRSSEYRYAREEAISRVGQRPTVRFEVSIPLPGPDALEQILRAHLGADAPADLTVVSRAARGQTPAAIAGAVRQARSRARTEGRPLDTKALIRAFGDPERQHPALRWRIAVHEAGHAMIAHVLHLGEIATLSIRGDGGEAVMHRAPSLGRIEDYHDQIAHALGGRAAEIVVFGVPTGGSGGGAESDLAIATHLALEVERCVGLGRNGLVWAAVDGIAARPMTAGEHAAVSKRLDEQCARAVRLLTHHRACLERLARRLAEMGHLVTAEIGEFLPEVDDAMIVPPLAHPPSEAYDSSRAAEIAVSDPG